MMNALCAGFFVGNLNVFGRDLSNLWKHEFIEIVITFDGERFLYN